MLEYKDFYEIAEYGNEAWKGSFTPKEIAENAYVYCADFQWSKENGEISHTIKELAKLLAEDGSDECKDWLYEMVTELGLIDMNFMDYMETDEDIVSRFLAEMENTTKNEIRIVGIMFEHGADDFSLWEGFNLTKEDSDAIQTILSKYETEGYSVRGTKTDVAKEIADYADELEWKNRLMELQYKFEEEE